MKIETNIIYLNTCDRNYAESLSGRVFNSIEDLKMKFTYDGIDLCGIQPLTEFQDEWNDTDDDVVGLRVPLMSSMISYVYIVK